MENTVRNIPHFAIESNFLREVLSTKYMVHLKSIVDYNTNVQ